MGFTPKLMSMGLQPTEDTNWESLQSSNYWLSRFLKNSSTDLNTLNKMAEAEKWSGWTFTWKLES